MPTYRLYDVIGVARQASPDEIKRAYRKQAVQHHPDKGGDEEQFKELTRAYEVLSDEEKRQRYDAYGDQSLEHNGSGGGGGGHPHNPFNDIFASMFGGGGFSFGGGGARHHHQQEQGTTFVHGIDVDLKDAYAGLIKTIKVQMEKQCMACFKTCVACNGMGHSMHVQQIAPGFHTQVMSPCTQCDGRGKRNVPGCGTCHSRGVLDEAKDIELKIPRGCVDGHELRFPGFGRTPHDVLVMKVRVRQDARLERDGNDLVFKSTVMFVDAVLGTTLHVPHFDGDVAVDTREWGVLNPARKYMVPGKGMVMPSGATGNLILAFEVCYPSSPLTDAAREALRPLLTDLA